jgi:hypothetical protein
MDKNSMIQKYSKKNAARKGESSTRGIKVRTAKTTAKLESKKFGVNSSQPVWRCS